MIRSFRSKVAQDIFDGTSSRHARQCPHELHGKARRLLDQLNVAVKIETLRIPPSNRLEKLRGSLKQYWSLRLNKQWRIIFQWRKYDAWDVDIIDYH